MTRAFAAILLVGTSAPLLAEPLTVHSGETWVFTIDHGDPSNPRKVEPGASPAQGEVKVSVRAVFGTMMTITNNSKQGYTFEARLIGSDGRAVAARTCTLPAGNQPALESWSQKASAVRIGSFKPANGGRC